MPRPAKDEKVTFQAGAGYWGGYNRRGEHSISPSQIVAIGRKKFGLLRTGTIKWYGANATPNFPVTKRKNCETVTKASTWYYQTTSGCSNSHTVPAIDVYNFCIEKLGMVEKTGVTEKIVEKIVKVPTEVLVEVTVARGYEGTLEKREVLAFALTRELRTTEHALRQAYIDNDAAESLRLAARVDVIREVMADMTVDLVEGEPQVVVARSPVKETLFDAV